MSSKKVITVPIDQIRPYERNPRINDDAVHDVAQSIKDCGYVQLIVVDENMTILCGHTRLKALKQLGYSEIPVQVEPGLTEKQKRMYRLLDNKTNEKAAWDKMLAAAEAEGLDFSEYEHVAFSADEIEEPNWDELFEDKEAKPKEPKKIQCPHCGEWFEA